VRDGKTASAVECLSEKEKPYNTTFLGEEKSKLRVQRL
jgi:hypothetical protein